MPVRQGYIDDAGVGHISLTQGKEALVDAHNFHWLSQWNWYARRSSTTPQWYALRNGQTGGTQLMHRVIMGVTDPNIQVDHVDREATLDNREDNIRVATAAQNGSNRSRFKNNRSGFKGVSWHKGHGKWHSQIQFTHKKMFLGYFNTAIEAAGVYNFAAKRLQGEFAVLNDLSQVTEVACPD